MRNILVAIAIAATALVLTGCSRSIGGPRFWWDDRNQERLPDYYQLPADPGAPADYSGYEDEPADPAGEDLSEDNLRNYRTNLDLEEEKRKSESSIVDF